MIVYIRGDVGNLVNPILSQVSAHFFIFMIHPIRYLVFKGEIIPLYYIEPNKWYEDKDGVVYAYEEDDNSTDNVVRCGVGLLSFPADSPLTAACAPHDFAYSSPVFQFFHTRAEADAYLLSLLETVSKGSIYSIFAKPFYYLARWFGGRYWENDRTR